MSFELESDLEDAGIDAFEFSLMDEDERREALEDAGLDTDTYLDADLDSDFNAWSDLQSSGLNIQELKWMDDNERREILKNSGLDPADYDAVSNKKDGHSEGTASGGKTTDSRSRTRAKGI